MSSYSGYIVANEKQLDTAAKTLELPNASVAGGPTLVALDPVFGIRRWREFRLKTSVPLADEIENSAPFYEYQVYIVIGTGKLILLASRRRIVDYVLANVLDRQIFPNYRKVNVVIERLIEFCTQVDCDFLITSLHGRFSGASRNLKSMSLYGDDVTNSSLYSQFHNLFNFHSCGVGRRLFEGLPKLRPNDEGEIVRLSNDGFVNLNLSTRRQAQELIQVVNFVVKNRWVDDWVPDISEGI